MRTDCSRWRAHATAPLTVPLLVMLGGPSAQAEVRTITATGEYRLQGKDTTPEDAKRLAIQEATHLALEQTVSYLQGMTEIKRLGVSKDDLRKYAAGLLEVTE